MKKRKPLTLIEYVANNPTERVCIGTKNGSGFTYIGDDILEGLEVMRECIERTHEKEIARRERKLIELKNVVYSKPEITSDDMTEDQAVFIYARRVNGLLNTIRSIDRYLNTFVPFENRVVTSHARKRDTDGRRIILINGSESDGYWFDYEYENKTINKEDLEY